MNHALIGRDRAAVEMLGVAADALRFSPIVARLPRPVRRAVVQAERNG